jgi:hypothetical protein
MINDPGADANRAGICSNGATIMAKHKRESSPDRWARLCQAAKDALTELNEMREEYADRYDNMNEGLQASAYGQKCEAMQSLDLDSAISAIDEAEGMEVPLGFGRD